MMTQEYVLPLTGKVKNWVSFTGDPDDPVRSVGVEGFLRDVPQKSTSEDPVHSVKIREIYTDEAPCYASVYIYADESFHKAFSDWLKDKSLEDIAAAEGVPILKRPTNAQKPHVPLIFNP